MNCPSCSATNDPNNQFCDQCGTRLQQPAPVAQPVVPTIAAAPAPTASSAAPTCPTCGSVILPGEAFCDNCGASLVGLAPVPTSVAVPVSEEAPAVVAAPLPEPTLAPEITPLPEPVPVVQPAPEPVATQPSDATVFSSAPISAPVAEPEPIVVAPAIDPQADYEAQKLSYEAEVTRSQQIVTQLDAVQAALGAATPAGVVQSLNDARAALAKAQADLAALAPPAPPVDPAVVAALNSEIAGQQQVVTQLEAVQAALGVATPAGVVQSLDAARSSLATLQGNLAALGIAPVAAPVPVPVVAPVAPVAAPVVVPVPEADAPTMVAPAPVLPSAQPVAPVVPPVVPVASGPRLIVEDGGKELPLVASKTEFIIGRSDPISGIYPEVDLTSYGGETSGVSRQHARLVLSAGQWFLTDLNSTNHTKIDGVRIDPNVPAPVQNGARLQFGRLTLLFRA